MTNRTAFNSLTVELSALVPSNSFIGMSANTLLLRAEALFLNSAFCVLVKGNFNALTDSPKDKIVRLFNILVAKLIFFFNEIFSAYHSLFANNHPVQIQLKL